MNQNFRKNGYVSVMKPEKKTIDTGWGAIGACIFKNKFVRLVLVNILPTQQKAQTYSWKGGSKLHAASVDTASTTLGSL